MYDDQLNWPTSSGYFTPGISSLRVLDMNYVIHIFRDINYGGAKWGFRNPVTVVDLDDYGLNDNTLSIKATYVGNEAGVTLYENAYYDGKSIYVGYGNFNSMSTASYFPNASPGTAGSIGNDKVSSLIALPYTNVVLYQDINLNIGCGSCSTSSYPNDASTILYVSQVSPNDWASSLIVGHFV